MKVEDFFELYNSSADGLLDEQIEKNREEFGTNVVESKKRESFFHIVLVQLGSFFSIVLLTAAFLLFALNEIVEFAVIVTIIFINVLIESVQRFRSDSIFESITKSIPGFSVVVRNGKTQKIESSHIVVGDIVLLNMGDKVPVDGIVIDSENFTVDESILTGESRTVSKEKSEIYSMESIIDNPHAVFSGSLVATGSAHVLVTQVGKETQLGMIAQKITTIDTELPIYKNIRKLSHTLFIFIMCFATFAFVVGMLHGQSWIELFKVIIALCVSAIPESMPVTITLILAYGFKRMSDKSVLVKKMQSLDVLGQIQVLALDKTGTITRNQMKVEKVCILGGDEIYVTGDGYEPEGTFVHNQTQVHVDSFEEIKNLITYSNLAASGTFVFDEKNQEWVLETGDPTEVAIRVLGAKSNVLHKDILDAYSLVEKSSFTNQAMYHSATYKKGKSVLTVYTGAPEVIFAMCTHTQFSNSVQKINDTHRDVFDSKMKEYASMGYRVLATSIKQGSKIIFQGMFAINDSIRLDIKESVHAVQSRDIEIIIITGDHRDIAFQVARTIGLDIKHHEVMTGDDMSNLTDTQLQNIILHKKVFSRVTPQQKLKILEMFRKAGKVIAMTGDGVNDALALVKADIGIAMGTLSSESAKEAADIVLLDNKFGSIVYGIEEGKNIFSNIKKTLTFLLSTNLAEMMVIVFAITLALPLPLSPVGILWVNFVTDTFLVLGFAFEREKIKKQKKDNFINIRDWARIIYLGIVMTSISLFIFLSNQDMGLVYAQSMTLLVLIVMQWFNILNIRAGNMSIFKYNFKINSAFIIGGIISAGLTIFAFNNQFLRSILNIEQISMTNVLYIIFCASFVIWFEEIRKIVRTLLFFGK